MKILTALEMGAADRRTSEQSQTSLQMLMEHAGAAVSLFCRRLYPDAARVLVICGRGNNGGDGLVVARHLQAAGLSVRVLVGGTGEFHGEAAQAFAQLRSEAQGIAVEELREGEEQLRVQDGAAWAELIVDAVVGTGFKPRLRGWALLVKGCLDAVKTPVVAVDLPSGWDADGMGEDSDGAFRADAVVTFTAPKLAHVFGHLTVGQTFGPVVVAEIGSPSEAVLSELGLTWTGGSKRIAEQPRDANSNKGKFGHVLMVGGSYGKAGAPSMSSLAALRTGAGLVTAAVPESIVNTVALVTPELMMMELLEGESGAASLANLEETPLAKLTKGISVLAIGPGLSTEGEASEFARGMVEKTTVPVVIDADALNAFAGKAEFFRAASGLAIGKVTRTVVLTPHPGEMARLAGMSIKEVEADRVGLARRFATEHGVTLVLKGWRTLVAHPDGRVAVNTSGNPGLAKGGSGDVLTGVVAAMVAQFPGQVAEAVEAAVYLHGLAADLAVGGKGGVDEHTLLATDVVEHLSDAFKYRVRDAEGFVWMCGLNTRVPS